MKTLPKVNHPVARGLVILLLLLASACSEAGQESSLPYPGPYPSNSRGSSAFQSLLEPGKASISGILYSTTVSKVVPKTHFYLTKAVGEANRDLPPAFIGPEQGKGDVAGITNEYGQFFLTNIQPGNYFVIVSTSISWSIAVISEANLAPLLIEIKPDQRQDLGTVYVSWP